MPDLRARIVCRRRHWYGTLTIDGVLVWEDDCRVLNTLATQAAVAVGAFRYVYWMGQRQFESWDDIVDRTEI